MKTICRCQHCNQGIEFDSADAGSATTCPHCGMETPVYVPQASPTPKKEIIFASDAPKKPIEDKLDSMASSLFTIGAFVLVCGIIAAAFTIAAASEHVPAAGVVFVTAIGFFIQCWVISLVLEWGAEVTRLLRAKNPAAK